MHPIDVRALFREELEAHRRTLARTAEALAEPFVLAVGILEEAVRAGRKLLLFGNGGSAADAQHLAAEFVVKYSEDRIPVPAIALTTDTSILTARANDLGFESIFVRQIDALGIQGDVAIGISTSGRSPNVLGGLAQARASGLRTIGLCGQDPSQMEALCDALLAVPSVKTPRIQEMHITLGHMLCRTLELRLNLVPGPSAPR